MRDLPSQFTTTNTKLQVSFRLLGISNWMFSQLLPEKTWLLVQNRKGVTPNYLSYFIMMSCFSQRNQLSEAVQVAEEMQAAGIRHDLRTFSLLADLYGRHGKVHKVKYLMKQLKKELAPDELMYTALV